MTREVCSPRTLAAATLLALLLACLPAHPLLAAIPGSDQIPHDVALTTLPAQAPGGVRIEREPVAPAADTDKWRLDDVRVIEWVCQYPYGPIRDEYGAIGVQSVNTVCNATNAAGGIIRTLHTEDTMRVDYPDLMQGGQLSTFAAEAAGSMTWELKDLTKTGSAWLEMSQAVVGMPGLCKYAENRRQDGGATGSASLAIERKTCSYDPGLAFSGKNTVTISFSSSALAGRIDSWSMDGSKGVIEVTYKRCTDPNNCQPAQIRRPVLVVPGILGAYFYYITAHQYWVLNRGVDPEHLLLDPLTHAYDDLVKTLKTVGYKEGKDLFAAPYDWRLTPGPVDGQYDGHLDGLTGASITDAEYQYGVDYLGFWLRLAAELWQKDHPGKTLDSVDLITHSTGGLVARSYIQSDAYGDTFVSQGQTMRLPRINNLIMVSVPNRGASQPWQAMNNNYIIDAASKYVISKMLNLAYQKVQQGQTITGFPQPITPDSIRDGFGNFSGTAFINQYVPTFRSLLATYDFYVGLDGIPTNLNMEPLYRNDLLLDLNNGLDMPDRPPPADASPFANHVKATVIYSDAQYTAYRVQEEVGPASNARFPLDAWTEQDVPRDVTYYGDIGAVLGDGTVPRESLVGQFEGDARVNKVRVLGGNTTHSGLMANPLVQQKILDTLGAAWLASDISTGLGGTSLMNVWNVTSDPVEMFLVDGSGRRLGYSASTGPVTELPDSVWYGGADGLGWVFGALDEPLSVTLTGLGGDYYVQVAGQQAGMMGGMESSGSLPSGQKKTIQVKTEPRGGPLYLPVILRTD